MNLTLSDWIKVILIKDNWYSKISNLVEFRYKAGRTKEQWDPGQPQLQDRVDAFWITNRLKESMDRMEVLTNLISILIPISNQLP